MCEDQSFVLTVTPKSGDVQVHVAPRLAVANMASTARAQFGRYPIQWGWGRGGGEDCHTYLGATNVTYQPLCHL